MEILHLQSIISRLKLRLLMFNVGGELTFSCWENDSPLGHAPENVEKLLALLDQSPSCKIDFMEFVNGGGGDFFTGDFVRGIDNAHGYYRMHASRGPSAGADSLSVHVEDISREYQLLAEMESMERQASAGQMAAGIAHEFNNILTAMMGWTQLAARAVQGNEPAELAIATIDNNTRRARRIAGELLDVANPSKNLEKQLLYVGDSLKDALKLLSWDLASQQINVIEEIYETRPTLASGTQLVQVFVNIIRNAMDAMGTGGTIGARVVQTGDSVLTTITDSGEGISDEALQKVFQPFFTTKSRHDKTYGGSGLGLSVSKRIVEQFGGTITLARNASPMLGTVVTLSFPTQEEVVESAADSAGRPSSFPPGVAVLVVDDEPDICEMIRMALNLRGAHVVSATNGEAALELSRKELFNAAFLDFSMAGLSGHELRTAISTAQPQLPIVFMSGVDIPDLDRNTDFLKKPFDLHDIQCKLREILDRQ